MRERRVPFPPLRESVRLPPNREMGLFHPRIDTPPLTRNGRRARLGPVLPWVFIIGVAIGTIAGNRYWRNLAAATAVDSRAVPAIRQ